MIEEYSRINETHSSTIKLSYFNLFYNASILGKLIKHILERLLNRSDPKCRLIYQILNSQGNNKKAENREYENKSQKRIYTSSIPNSTTFSCKEVMSLMLNLDIIVIAEMVDMGQTSRSSITM